MTNHTIIALIILPASGSHIYVSVDPYSPPLGMINHHLVAVISDSIQYAFASVCYQYLASLHALQAAVPPKERKHPKILSVIKSSLSAHLLACQASLSSHPDKDFATVEMDGLQHRFWVGFDHSGQLRPAHQNMPSKEQHPEVIDWKRN